MEDRKEVSREAGESRRDAIRKMAYAAPVVLSLAASPSLARAGSSKPATKPPDCRSEPRKKPGQSYINN